MATITNDPFTVIRTDKGVHVDLRLYLYPDGHAYIRDLNTKDKTYQVESPAAVLSNFEAIYRQATTTLTEGPEA